MIVLLCGWSGLFGARGCHISEDEIAVGGCVVSDPLMNSSGREARSSSARGPHRIMTKPALAANETCTNEVEITTNSLKLLESLQGELVLFP